MRRLRDDSTIMGSVPVADFDHIGEKVLSPRALAHVVLRTDAGNFQKMADFYTAFLGGRVTHGNDFLSFITYDEEHHRIALIGMPGTGPKVPTSSGLEHIAFTFPTVSALLVAYRQRQARGICPVWCASTMGRRPRFITKIPTETCWKRKWTTSTPSRRPTHS